MRKSKIISEKFWEIFPSEIVRKRIKKRTKIIIYYICVLRFVAFRKACSVTATFSHGFVEFCTEVTICHCERTAGGTDRSGVLPRGAYVHGRNLGRSKHNRLKADDAWWLVAICHEERGESSVKGESTVTVSRKRTLMRVTDVLCVFLLLLIVLVKCAHVVTRGCAGLPVASTHSPVASAHLYVLPSATRRFFLSSFQTICKNFYKIFISYIFRWKIDFYFCHPKHRACVDRKEKEITFEIIIIETEFFDFFRIVYFYLIVIECS